MLMERERESSAVRHALAATDPRSALRVAVRQILNVDRLPKRTLIDILGDLADEHRQARQEHLVAAIVEVIDILEGEASDHAIDSYVGDGQR